MHTLSAPWAHLFTAQPCPCPTGIKKLNNSQQQPGSDRFRLLLSDGEFSYSAMLATQFSHVVLSGQIKETSIIRVIDYLCNQLQEKK